jgi:hypothetical protein
MELKSEEVGRVGLFLALWMNPLDERKPKRVIGFPLSTQNRIPRKTENHLHSSVGN